MLGHRTLCNANELLEMPWFRFEILLVTFFSVIKQHDQKKNDLRKNEFNLAFYFRRLREHQMTAMAAGKEAERSQLNHEQEAQSELQAGQSCTSANLTSSSKAVPLKPPQTASPTRDQVSKRLSRWGPLVF